MDRLRRFTVSLIGCVLVGVLSIASAQSTADEPFFFLHYSDPQFGMFTSDADFVQETTNFEFAIATANRLRPVFVVVTGDLVNRPGDAAQIAEYHRIASQLDPSIPLYNVSGNHDVGATPTPESVALYREQFGPDYYTFRHGSFVGIVINSSVIRSPEGAPGLLAAQEAWLRTELAGAQAAGAQPVVLFQHHSWFLREPDESDEWFNIPLARRVPYLSMLHEFGVTTVFAGHYHQNAQGRDGDLEMVTTGPVGQPLGEAKSGIRIVVVDQGAVRHRYYELSEIPNTVVTAEP